MTSSLNHRVILLGALGAGMLAFGCGSDDGRDRRAETMRALSGTYADIVLASYEDSVAAAAALHDAVHELVEAPTQTALANAQKAWRDAREPYLQTEVYRFYEGPIDNAEDGPEGRINAWPLDESYIDYTAESEDSGIVNDPAVTIDAETLSDLNEQGSEENIATGYHAIEFLLWGQDLSADGPGGRQYTDYVVEGDAASPNADRRAAYLSTVADLLVADLEQVTAHWEPGAENYRAEFEAAEPEDSFRRVLTGMIVLSGFETGGERLENAILTGEQNDEHSCFSDNTHRDMVQDVQGVLNVWQGSYVRIDGEVVQGTGVADVVATKDAALADELDAKIRESLDLAEAIEPPFDNEIALDNVEGRARVRALSVSLREQEALLQKVFRAFDLTIPEEPM